MAVQFRKKNSAPLQKKSSKKFTSKIRVNPVLLWPIWCALLFLIIWGATFLKIHSTQKIAEENAFEKATALSNAYSEQLIRAIQEIESITLNLKYQWEHKQTNVDLQDQFNKGLYPPTSQYYVSLLDKEGLAFASTLQGPKVNSSDRNYFKFHKENKDSSLHIDPVVSMGRLSHRPVIRFTRRLETKTGVFDGLVLVSVEPTYLATFNDQKSLNPHDFISIRHDNGTLLVSEKGSALKGEAHVSPPVFSSPSGIMRMSEENYKDRDARILAWKKLDGYPLVSYVGLSEKDLLVDHEKTAANYRQIAVLASVFLLFAAMFGMYFSSRLASRRKQAEEIKKTYSIAIDHAREGFYMMRALYSSSGELEDFLIEDCNERGANIVGYSKSDLIGALLSQVRWGEDTELTMPIFKHAMDTGFHEDEVNVADAIPGQPSWLQRRLVRSQTGLAVTVRDISDSKQQEQLLISTANTDALTSLPNRYWFLNYLPTAIGEAKANNKMIAILFIDLDNFKDVNDSLGHEMGDKLLCLAALRLKSLVRSHDTVVRLGGDEFTILLNTFDNVEEVAQIASRIASSFAKEFSILDHSISVGASIGISLFPEDGTEPDILVQRADIAMYAAKADGKLTYRFYDQRLFDRIKAQTDAADDLRRAVSSKQFEVHYQPRVDTFSSELKGLEALVRWRHPIRGMVSPCEFIPLAEKNGSIVALGTLILEQVCIQIKKWRDHGERVVPVSINVSPIQLDAGGVDKLIMSMLSKYELTPDMLEVELTESSMMNESQDVMNQVMSIRERGIKIHIDDFGTGYSSLSRLQEVKTQVLKVDRAFTSKLGLNKEANILFKTIVQMAKALEMDVIAEGVETEEQLAILKDLGCDEVQGFLISKPLPADAITALLRQRFLRDRNVVAITRS